MGGKAEGCNLLASVSQPGRPQGAGGYQSLNFHSRLRELEGLLSFRNFRPRATLAARSAENHAFYEGQSPGRRIHVPARPTEPPWAPDPRACQAQRAPWAPDPRACQAHKAFGSDTLAIRSTLLLRRCIAAAPLIQMLSRPTRPPWLPGPRACQAYRAPWLPDPHATPSLQSPLAAGSTCLPGLQSSLAARKTLLSALKTATIPSDRRPWLPDPRACQAYSASQAYKALWLPDPRACQAYRALWAAGSTCLPGSLAAG